MKILTVIGTRPEAIKLAPVIRALAQKPGVQNLVCATAQHREMLDSALKIFGLVPDFDLDLMTDNQKPAQVAAAVLSKLDPILQQEQPDWVLVQGDTTTTAAAALAAFYQRVKVGHVEAGLRTFDKWRPFPEEINRQVATIAADLHFAPTAVAKQNLLREGVPQERILITGNPVIDALESVCRRAPAQSLKDLLGRVAQPGRKLILVTAHRRENWGAPLADICLALREIAESRSDEVQIVYPVHLNPNVKDPVERLLHDVANVTLLPPVDYVTLVNLMRASYLIVTDSGGIQEEAPALSKPVLVLRDATERPEAVEAGAAKVIGTSRRAVVSGVSRLLDDTTEYQSMAQAVSPYGDGRAGERIVAALCGEECSAFEGGKEVRPIGMPAVEITDVFARVQNA